MSANPFSDDFEPPVVAKPVDQPRPRLSGKSLLILLGVVSGVLAISNATVLPVSSYSRWYLVSEIWTGLTFGLIGAQGGLVGIGSVLGPGRGLARQMFAAVLGAAWILAWLIGYELTWLFSDGRYFYPHSPDVFSAILVIPVMVCAGELPLWILRGLLRWRIESAFTPRFRGAPHLSIAGILLAMAAVALALTSVRAGKALLGTNVREAEWWFAVAIAMAFSCGISLVTLPVCVWTTLRWSSLGIGVAAAMGWLSLVACALICIISAMLGSWPPLRLEFWMVLLALICGFGGGVMGPLSLLRAGGYRLYWGGERAEAIPSASAAKTAIPSAPQP